MRNDGLAMKLLAFIGLFMSLHYLLSYIVIYKILSPYKLAYTNILSIEDMLFSVADFNLELIKLIITGLSVIVGIDFVSKHATKTSLSCKIDKINWMKIPALKDFIYLMIDFSIIFLCKWLAENDYQMLLFIIPIIYLTTLYQSQNQRDIRIFAAIFIYSFFFTSQAIKERPNLYTSNIVLQLDGGLTVSSDSTNTLVFYGTKYIVFKDGNTSNANVYPTSEVKSFKWINEKENLLDATKEIELIKKDSIN